MVIKCLLFIESNYTVVHVNSKTESNIHFPLFKWFQNNKMQIHGFMKTTLPHLMGVSLLPSSDSESYTQVSGIV